MHVKREVRCIWMETTFRCPITDHVQHKMATSRYSIFYFIHVYSWNSEKKTKFAPLTCILSGCCIGSVFGQVNDLHTNSESVWVRLRYSTERRAFYLYFRREINETIGYGYGSPNGNRGVSGSRTRAIAYKSSSPIERRMGEKYDWLRVLSFCAMISVICSQHFTFFRQ